MQYASYLFFGFYRGIIILMKELIEIVAKFKIESGFYFTSPEAVSYRVRQVIAKSVKFAVELNSAERCYVVTFNKGTTLGQAKKYAASLARLIRYKMHEYEFTTPGLIVETEEGEVKKRKLHYTASFSI